MSHALKEKAAPNSKKEHEGPSKIIDEPVQLVHHHPGYLRVYADAFLAKTTDESAIGRVESAAETVPGFRSWSHNTKTGTVVIKYDPSVLEADEFLKHLAIKSGFNGVINSTSRKRSRQELVGAFLDSVQGINHIIADSTGERADLREMVPIALAATSVISFIVNDQRGRLPEWSGALYHSYRIFMHWHRKEVRDREKVGLQEEERRNENRFREFSL